MSSSSTPNSQSVEVAGRSGGVAIWGIRVAVLLALFDILVMDQIPANYYLRLQSPTSVLFTPGQETAGLIGHLILVAALVGIAFIFPQLLVQRPFWYRRGVNRQAATPTMAAVSASATAIIGWTAAVIFLSYTTHLVGEATFKYSGSVLFILLVNVLAFLYAGFVAASGDAAQARRQGALAGLVCGLVAAIAWGVVDAVYGVTGNLDLVYAIAVSVARLILFPALGYLAGAQGGTLWSQQGAGAPRRVRPQHAGSARFQLGAGTLWAAVGFLLIAIFYAPSTTAAASTAAARFGQFVSSALISWVVVLLGAAVLVALLVGLRRIWPALAGARGAIWRAILFVLAIGGAGDRLRSRGIRRVLVALTLMTVLLWPYIDQYVLGSGSDARVSVLSDAGFYVILALGLNVVVGFAGLLDLGYVAFFVFGSYTWAMLGAPEFSVIAAQVHRLDGLPIIPQHLPFGLDWAWWFWPGLLIGALIAAGFGVLLGAPTLRLRGDYLAIVTLGFGEIVPIAFKNIPKLTEGTNGINGIPSPLVPGLEHPIFAATPYYYIILVLIGVAIVCNIRLRDSRLGRAWVALREDEIATATSGVNTVRTKLMAFATGAFFSGLAGVYHSSKLGIITPGDFSFGDSIIYLAMVVLGGIGSIPGVIVGALVIALLNLYLLGQVNALSHDPTSSLYFLHNIDISNFRNIIFGGLLVIMMLLRPEGLIPNVRRRAELHGEVAAETEAPVLSSLDAAIGGPAYTEERVE
jgi:ABC-type branched-subunit amino acid transport system permease subunit